MNPMLRWALGACLVSATMAWAQSTVTFDNQSGEPALVRLIGATSAEVPVGNGQKSTVSAAAGKYIVKVRYGAPDHYRYSQGDEFTVTETAATRSSITITLHKVIDGNYGTRDISEGEFGAAAPRPSKAEAWKTDWLAFGAEIKAHLEAGRPQRDLWERFEGAVVEWEGTIIEKTVSEGTLYAVHVAMDPITVAFADGKTTTVQSLGLSPAAAERAAWGGRSAGMPVRFRTTLKENKPLHCINVVEGAGRQAGQRLILIFTEGATLLGNGGKPGRQVSVHPATTNEAANQINDIIASLGESPRLIQQTLEFVEAADKPQTAIVELIAAVKAASSNDEIAASIRKYAPRTYILTTGDMASVLRAQLPGDTSKKILGGLVDDPERTRRLVATFFPMRKGMSWEYGVSIKGDYWISDGCLQAVRKAKGPTRLPNMRVSVEDVSSDDNSSDARLSIENDVMRYDPGLGADQQTLYPGQRCPVCRPLAEGLSAISRHGWKAIETPRTGPDGKQMASRNVNVSARITRLWKDPQTGQGKSGLCWHEVFFSPLMDSVARTDGFSGIKSRFRLGDTAVTTPAGSYTDCVERLDQVVLGGEKWTNVAVFCRGAGLVQSIQRNPRGEVTLEVSLLKLAGAE